VRTPHSAHLPDGFRRKRLSTLVVGRWSFVVLRSSNVGAFVAIGAFATRSPIERRASRPSLNGMSSSEKMATNLMKHLDREDRRQRG
jgi:hypothetical protein